MTTTFPDTTQQRPRTVSVQLSPLEQDLNIIQKLDTEPNDTGGLTPNELKRKFDEAGNLIKTYINTILVPAVIAQLPAHDEDLQAHLEIQQALGNYVNEVAATIVSSLKEHTRSTANPHQVTAEQTGAIPFPKGGQEGQVLTKTASGVAWKASSSPHGKSAYEAALDGGYSGSEADFAADLAAVHGLSNRLAQV